MAVKKAGKKPEKKPLSALRVMRGVRGGHDGLPEAVSRTNAKHRKISGWVLTTQEYVRGVLEGDRAILGRAITLIESNAPAHQDQAQEVLRDLIPYSGKSMRIGITGTPGAGKSTFIEALGCYLTDHDHKVAVMAVDPSSSLTKGSILGDKTRMEELSRRANAFIRPSPSGGTLGGVARKTRETMLVFEAAGYDVILVETIGVGQSEIAVRSMVDFFLLIMIAGGGDELQGFKKGVMELADAIVINKADGNNVRAAQFTRDELARALHYLMPRSTDWRTEVYTASALRGEGIDNIWKVVENFRAVAGKCGLFAKQRREQAREWLHSLLQERLRESFYSNEKIKKLLPEIEKDVLQGTIPAVQAARNLLKLYSDQYGSD